MCLYVQLFFQTLKSLRGIILFFSSFNPQDQKWHQGCKGSLVNICQLLLLLLSRFSRVRLCVTPQTAAHQAPPSLTISRQEYWSGLPFPSPVHESDKWKSRRVRLLATPWTAAYQAPPSMGFSRWVLEWVSIQWVTCKYLHKILTQTIPHQ